MKTFTVQFITLFILVLLASCTNPVEVEPEYIWVCAKEVSKKEGRPIIRRYPCKIHRILKKEYEND